MTRRTDAQRVAETASYVAELADAFSARRCSVCGAATVMAVRPGSDGTSIDILGTKVLERRGAEDRCLCRAHLLEAKP